jgi:RNA polymerase sigma-B factor
MRFSFIILQFLSRHIEKQRLWSGARSLCGSGWILRSGDRQAKQEATAALLAAYHHGGDRDARARVIEQNLPLVRALARRFSRPGEPLDDLVQVASIGLIKAVDGYREERGRDLGAYAVPTIVGELRRHVRGTLPAAADGGRPGRSTTAIVDAIPDARSTAELERGETRALVHSGLRSLSRRERRIVALRYYRDLSQQRIADEVGLSQVQVSRVLATSLTKLRHAVGAG